MNDRELKRILNNISNKLFFKYLGDVNIFNFSKVEIKNLITAIEETTKEHPKSHKWQRDREYLITRINEWCDAFRCSSLLIPTR